MNKDNRFESLIASLTPVLEENLPVDQNRKEALVKRTYVVDEFTATVAFPQAVAFRHQDATPADEEKGTPAKPEYDYASINGGHLHVLEGATGEQVVSGQTVNVQLRIRTVEPLVDREGARRNYEPVLRFTPATGPATKRVTIEPARDIKSTQVDPDRGVLCHKGMFIRVAGVNQPRGERRDPVHAPERTNREGGARKSTDFRW